MSHQVPNELWREILCHLPRNALQNGSLVCHTFFALSRPFLFADFYFHVGQGPRGRAAGRTLAEDGVRALERLDFWSSNDIAPLVRSCTLGYHADGDNLPLFDAFFDRLPRFNNLRTFEGIDIELTQTRMAALHVYPALKSFHLRGWRAAPREQIDFASILLTVRRLFVSGVGIREWTDSDDHAAHLRDILEAYSGVQWLLYSFLSRPTLTRIDVFECHPLDLVNELRGVSTCANITFLDMRVNVRASRSAALDTEALRAICRLTWPNLWLVTCVDLTWRGVVPLSVPRGPSS
ncbi:hypothetical protein B0H16DRAFT_1458795 [Mycena metata]|uniref:F-box domain-containing protein n=1 Tax=Mycena metata TaxID=1033252 RepID=A0AAD7NDJ4_9AGAR|nr:hypothetical protein B0H16DRAFT_1458795 [Mycena metata]